MGSSSSSSSSSSSGGGSGGSSSSSSSRSYTTTSKEHPVETGMTQEDIEFATDLEAHGRVCFVCEKACSHSVMSYSENDPNVDCVVVLNHVLHKSCYASLVEQGLIQEMPRIPARRAAKQFVFQQDLCVIENFTVAMNIDDSIFQDSCLRNAASKHRNIQVFTQMPNAEGVWH